MSWIRRSFYYVLRPCHVKVRLRSLWAGLNASNTYERYIVWIMIHTLSNESYKCCIIMQQINWIMIQKLSNNSTSLSNDSNKHWVMTQSKHLLVPKTELLFTKIWIMIQRKQEQKKKLVTFHHFFLAVTYSKANSFHCVHFINLHAFYVLCVFFQW